ncbi:amino acid-binding ACT domain protein [Shewanella halifaxensis HAW-EB4]|uniref:Amino acid-binding ACT domain protein n=1 Tax=Shewanella halifaxensis (strain HAW-EB4) TaxID=458817 RepID=B0TV33_SHEHH|nr:ACT domain-containing protein [Shewanella halifaxensis]ABZ78300.1 amino acid-binding ACT domain protein [Shewanella halifaxensis HAW-EB4]
MKKTFVTTVSGVTEPGIIKSLAEITRKHGGEWQMSKVIKLGGHFTALFEVTIEAESQPQLESDFVTHFPALYFSYALVAERAPSACQRVKLVFDCNDRPGLTRDIDDILADLEVELESLECHRLAVIGMSSPVFSSILTLAIPGSITSERVIESLEGLSDDVRVSQI